MTDRHLAPETVVEHLARSGSKSGSQRLAAVLFFVAAAIFFAIAAVRGSPLYLLAGALNLGTGVLMVRRAMVGG
ncbi:MAG: hypothetical protein RL398_858 [Planctomycetota bacterium]|jgi:hypothetical protein